MTFKKFLNMYEAIDDSTLRQIGDSIEEIGPDVELYIVGGSVRDLIMSIDSKDIDFVVTKMPFERAEDALHAIYETLLPMVDGKVNKVGESFGIVTATINGEDFDFAIPRRKETKTGDGHADFDVDLDPTASIATDLARRDFTINAMAQDKTGAIYDPLGGQTDLLKGLIRAVGDPVKRFREDPLRMVRAIQFASRLTRKDGKPFTIEEKTLQAIVDNVHLVREHISGERVLGEFEKAWTKGSANINVFIDLLKETGIGEDLFGSDFDPKPITIQGSEEEKKIARFVGLFANGGEKGFLKIHPNLPTYYTDFLQLFRHIQQDEKEPWEYIRSHKDKIPLLAKIAQGLTNTFGEDPVKLARKMMQVPILPKELAVDGMELMKMGLKGREIGAAQKEVLSALWNGKITNKKEDIMRLLNKDSEDKVEK